MNSVHGNNPFAVANHPGPSVSPDNEKPLQENLDLGFYVQICNFFEKLWHGLLILLNDHCLPTRENLLSAIKEGDVKKVERFIHYFEKDYSKEDSGHSDEKDLTI